MPTQAEIGNHLCLSTRGVRDLLARGIIPAGADLDSIRSAYIRYLRDVASGRQGQAAGDQLNQERTRLTRLQADKTELELGVLRGDLQPTERVMQEYGDLVMAARAKLLALPGRAAPLAMAAANLAEAEAAIKRLVYEALNELATRRDNESLESDSGAVETAANADD